MNYDIYFIMPQFDFGFVILSVVSAFLVFGAYRLFRVGKKGMTFGYRTFGNIHWVMFDGVHTLSDLKKNYSQKYFRAEYMQYPKTIFYGLLYLIAALLVFSMTFIEIAT
jgi:hypothetical protein